MKLVLIKSNKKTGENEILGTYEMFQKDTAEDQVYTVPGFESIPLDGDKVLRSKLSSGDNALFLVPLKTELKKGERRVFSTDEDGNETAEITLLGDKTASIKNDQISLTIDKNGKIEIKNLSSDDLIKLIHDLSTNLQTAITDLISATVPTALGPQFLSVAASWVLPAGLLSKAAENTTKINLYKK